MWARIATGLVVVAVLAAVVVDRDDDRTDDGTTVGVPTGPTTSTSTGTTTTPIVEDPLTPPPPVPPDTPPPPTLPVPAPPGAPTGRGGPDLARLVIDDTAVRPGSYSRELFPTWLDLDGNGCDARDDTLIAESRIPVTVGTGACDVVAGDWISIYDGETFATPSGLDVDHLVPLADAWRSGAHAWDAARRAAFANDLADPDHLIAVSAGSNRAKSDSPPDEWRPPIEAAWCRYATAWANVKIRWELTVTTDERDALGQMLATC